MTKTRKVQICVEMRYSDALLLAEIRYEGPLKELNNFGVKEGEMKQTDMMFVDSKPPAMTVNYTVNVTDQAVCRCMLAGNDLDDCSN